MLNMELQQEQQGESKRLPLQDCRWKPERIAADYMGETIKGFRARVKRGNLPEPSLSDAGRKSWDTVLLDKASDKISNIGDNSDGVQAALDAIN